ncbi:polyprenyl synthetase family protein [Microbacterium indicum]|uniref:polyprenyl synthetase family protein n=1 Tax=Microbacterium indicum TaxID=358100 RepID=UPI000418A1EA|nr:polyprenyl synthetase family protein [Microbacterium indicum]
MPTAPEIITAISRRLENFSAEREREIAGDPIFAADAPIDPVARLLLERAREALAGGKRLRARFAAQGWRAATGGSELPAHVIDLGAALEVFQAAALVHDDLVDNSDTRRGRPATHRAFEAAHREAGWIGDAAEFGRSAAILLGDLLLGWSDDLLETALLRTPGTAAATRADYARMRRDVILGQLLDVAEESSWPTLPDATHAERALRIATLKSARYSVQQPLILGASIGGASPALRSTLLAFGHPVGLAFQLRDDELGVFGDPEITGKPAGDDLREGKRTLLIAYAREGMGSDDRARIDERLGAPDLSAGEIAAMQDAIRSSGALDRVEEEIARCAAEAAQALDAGDAGAADAELRVLISDATRRRA